MAANCKVEFYLSGKLWKLELGKEFAVTGYFCKKGDLIRFYQNGKLHDCWFSKPQKIGTVTCKKVVTFYDIGKLERCCMGADIVLSGHNVKAGEWITFSKTGQMHRWEMDTPRTIEKLSCKGGFNYFYPNGKLWRCGELVKALKIGGKKFKAGASVCFDKKGKVAACSKFDL